MTDLDKATFKDFNTSTLVDAEKVACAAFGGGHMSRILRKILANPYAKEIGANSFGDIAYIDGRPVAFQAIIPWRLYNGQVSFCAAVGSSLGVMPGTSPLVLLDLIQRPTSARLGSRLQFANTANLNTVRLTRFTNVTGRGGDSWKGYRYSIIHPIRFMCYLVWSKMIKRPYDKNAGYVLIDIDFVNSRGGIEIRRQTFIDKVAFDDFWSRYIKSNKGIVSSRTADEVEWMFGEGVKCGTDVLLASFRNDAMCGYVIVWGETVCRWKIVEMIAIDNDVSIIAALLRTAKQFLLHHSHAAMLRIYGFPEFILNVIASEFPHRRPGTHVPFIYEPFDIPKETSWFFGPYDGDADL